MEEPPINVPRQPQPAINVSAGNVDLENVQLEVKAEGDAHVHIGHKIVTKHIVQHIYQSPEAAASPASQINSTLILSRLQNSLRAYYSNYTHLERLFDDTQIPIAQSFINLALIKEAEHKSKEKDLGQSRLEEKNDGGEKAPSPIYVDERLASHEQLYAVKEPLALTELFESKDDVSTPNKVLVLGRAGIGKSILCQYLATQWASEEKEAMPVAESLQKKFDAVFWVKLREIAADVREEERLVDVLDRFCLAGSKADRPTKQELIHYLEKESSKVLFILDGYDEITEHRQLDRILEELSTHTNLLLTSRPIVIEKLGNQRMTFDRRLENMGFLNENIEAYIQQFMALANQPEQAPLMLNFLKSHAGVWGIAHIPINLELLSWLWSKGELTLGQGQVITLSKLYQIIIDRVQDAYVQKASRQASGLTLNDAMESKAEGDVVARVNPFLEYLAFHAMEKETLFISAKDIAAALIETLLEQQYTKTHHVQLLKSVTDKLGFLRSTGQGGKSQLDQAHYFIHLSFQEFYAARYVARILTEQPHSAEAEAIFQLICREKYTSRYQLMLWMSAGLLYQRVKNQDRKSQQFSSLAHFCAAILSQPRDLIGFHHRDLVMHCLDECEADPNSPLYQTFMQQHKKWVRSNARGTYMMEQLKRCPVLFASRPIVDGLLQDLKDGNEDSRSAAALYLGELNNPSSDVIAALLRSLEDEKNKDMFVMGEVCEALGNLNNPSVEVIAALVEAVKDKNVTRPMKYSPAKALVKLHNSSEIVTAALVEMMKHEDERVRARAVLGLGKLNSSNSDVITVLIGAVSDQARDVRSSAVSALGMLDKNNLSNDVIAALLKALKDEDQGVVSLAVGVLAQLNNLSDTVITALLEVAKNRIGYVRGTVLEALSKLNNLSENMIVALLKAVKDEDGAVRLAGVAALGGLKNPSEAVSTALLEALKDKDGYVRRFAVNAIGKLDNFSEAMSTALLEVLKDKDKDVRYAAVDVIGKLNNLSEAMNTALLELVQDKNRDVRYAAVRVLDKLSKPSEAVIMILLEAVKDEDDTVRRAGVAALGSLKDPSETVMAILLGAVKNESVRHTAVDALGRLKEPNDEMIAVLIDAVSDKNSSVRNTAVSALGKLSTPNETVMLALSRAVKDENERVRENAAEMLGKLTNISEAVVGVLMQALNDKEYRVRGAATKSLRNLSSVHHLNVIFASLTSPELCADYFEILSKQNYLLCIDHSKGHLIIRPGRETHCIPMPQERLQYFEEQILAVAKKDGYPLEALGFTLAPSQANNPARLMSHSARQSNAMAPPPPNKKECLVM